MKKIILTLLILSISFTLYSQDNIKEVTILHWNDLHARNLPYKISKKDSATGKSIYYYVGGTSSILGYLNKFRNKSSLVLNAGDDFQGTPISTLTRGRSQIELLNLFGLDAFVLGNHEFDYGQYALDSALQLAKFDYLSANIFYEPKHSTFGKSYVIKNINGVMIGIIGITEPDLPKGTLPKNINEVIMLNTDSIITVNIGELKKAQCNLIILLTHEGVEADKLVAEKFHKDIDVIVGGHSHTPLFRPFIDSGVVIVQAGCWGRWLGELNLKVDIIKDTISGYYGKLIETIFDSTIYDRQAEQKVEGMIASIGKDMLKVIGELKSDWKASYSKESNLGQFEADMFRERTGTDIAFINGGGLRKSLANGDITVSDIWEINPFGNDIETFSVSGSMLEQMLINHIRLKMIEQEQQGAGEILDVSGMTYTFNSKKIEEDSLNTEISITFSGQPLDRNKMYSIATNSFVTSQFVNFFGEFPAKPEFKTTGLIDRDIIIDAVKMLKTIDSPLEKRIIDLSGN
ncbi:MAG: bifunctional UDP-sugar hydrolase/5'-nucleotidase [Ignavibacteria bacterium]|jgi:2',3'-cyclic-nucleotide 2'-phosphodiesterase (5'-nucleotidase family)